MNLIQRLFQKSAPRKLFTFAFPQAPASLENRNYLQAYRGWVYACAKRKADALATMELTLQRKLGDEWKEVTTGPNSRRSIFSPTSTRSSPQMVSIAAAALSSTSSGTHSGSSRCQCIVQPLRCVRSHRKPAPRLHPPTDECMGS